MSRSLRDIAPVRGQGGAMREMPRFRRARGRRSRDLVVQSAPTSSLLAAPMTSFDGISNVDSVLPPDTNAGVGPNHIVEWVNLSFAVYAKGSPTTPATRIYGPANGNTLWSGFGGPCETTNNGDPIVRYDHLADRWVMSQLAIPNSLLGLVLFPPFYECIAVSATPDPLGPYYRYQYSFDKLNDYPKLGVWPDAYYMSMNQFTAPSLTFAGQGVAAFDRHAMLSGQPASMIYFDLEPVDSTLGGMLPADLDGPTPPGNSPDYFVQVDDDAWGYAPDQLQLWQFHVDWDAPGASSFVHVGSMPTAPFDSNLCDGAETCIPQPGTSATLDPLADRLMYRLQYRNFGDHESLVVNHTVDADGSNHAGVRWYEIRDPRGAPWIYQQGTYAPDGDHRWMASAAMDRAGNLAIGFSVSSATTFPSVRYAARLATDPPGVLAQGETDLVSGVGSQTHSSGRWGDYSTLDVDPVDDCTFWYTQEYYASTSSSGWRTRIGSFKLPGCDAPLSNLPVITLTATTPVATESGAKSGIVTVTRTGDTTAPLTALFTVGGTATPGSDYVPLIGSVTIDAGADTAAIQIVPIDDTLVENDETVSITLSPHPSYAVGSPGFAMVNIVSDDLPSDLVVTALSSGGIGGAGAQITVTDTTKNQGSGTADASTTGYYLSKNGVLDAADILIGTRNVPSLIPGSSDSGTASAMIPPSTTTGTYYVIAKADVADLLPETTETNNTRFAIVTIGPDLIVSSIAAPAIAGAGSVITVSDTTTDRGGDSAAASTTTFYLSKNGLVDSNDVALGNRAVPALTAGAGSSTTTSLTIPPSTPTGVYYVVALADSANAVVETTETNNTRATAAIRVGPDLAIASTTAPAIGGAGATIVVGDTTKNSGAGAAGSSITAYSLSTTISLNVSAIGLGSRPVPPLTAGASASGSATVTLPPNLPTGTYFVIASADANSDVAETTEANNNGTGIAIKIGPDLTVSAATPTSSKVAAGATFGVSATILNQGGGTAAGSRTKFYLSTNLAVDSSDILLGNQDFPPLNAGQSSTAQTTLTIPSGTPPATYWLVTVADGDGSIVETTESNNTRAAVIQVN